MSAAAGLRRAASGLRRDAGGAAAIGFLLVFAPLMAMLTLAMQVALSHFSTLAGAAAAEDAARLAATLPIAHCAALRNAEGERLHELDPAFAAVPPAAADARACLNDPSPCRPMPGVWTCTLTPGGDPAPECDVLAMRRILERARRTGVRLERVEVSWRDSRLGEVGGPVAPLVSVTVRQRPLGIAAFGPGRVGGPAPATASVVGEAAGRGKWEGPQC